MISVSSTREGAVSTEEEGTSCRWKIAPTSALKMTLARLVCVHKFRREVVLDLYNL